MANVRGRDLASFVGDARSRVEQEVKLPPGYFVTYGGTFEQLQSASRRLSVLVPLSLLMIVGLLFMTFGSLEDALLVFSGVPLALTGGILALLIRGIPLSITAGVGFITLSGVAVLTGVVMVSAIRELRRDGVTLEAAITRGALMRLRSVGKYLARWGFTPQKPIKRWSSTPGARFLILDNLGVHRCKPVKAWLAEHRDPMEVFYLPSYSPELNLEERLNADLKHVIRRKMPARTKAKLRAATEDHMTVIDYEPERVKAYFRDPHVKYAA